MTVRPDHDMRRIEWEACLLEPRPDPEIDAFARREMGMVPEDIPYFAPCPWVARMIVTLSQRLAVRLDPRLADTIGLVVSHENSCRFCYAMVRSLLRIQGMSEDRVQELEQQLGGDAEPRTAAVIGFARRMARSAPLIGAADREALARAGFGPEEYREIAFVVAFMVCANRMTTIPAMPPHGAEQAPQSWRFRLMRPFYARWMAPFTTRASRVPRSPAPVHFGRLIGAYDGTAIGSTLAETINAAWVSPILRARTKALMFAVIARGLGCPVAVGEAEAMLMDSEVDPATRDRALEHLHAPELGETENLLLGFARDTLWYRPAAIQRRARGIRDRLTPAEFIEAVGVCAVANAFGRLCAAVGGR
jgi:AhpD family alkylhydroperoxidase